jgi:hypothetical protein
MFPEKCSCKMPQKCCHILAVQAKLGKPLCVYKTTFSSLINAEKSGSQKKSMSGSKRNYQLRNSKEIEVIENGNIHIPYLMELIIEKDLLAKDINRKFEIKHLQTDCDFLSEIFMKHDSHDFLKVHYLFKAFLFIIHFLFINHLKNKEIF